MCIPASDFGSPLEPDKLTCFLAALVFVPRTQRAWSYPVAFMSQAAAAATDKSFAAAKMTTLISD